MCVKKKYLVQHNENLSGNNLYSSCAKQYEKTINKDLIINELFKHFQVFI